jgi:hypothetical protein
MLSRLPFANPDEEPHGEFDPSPALAGFRILLGSLRSTLLQQCCSSKPPTNGIAMS